MTEGHNDLLLISPLFFFKILVKTKTNDKIKADEIKAGIGNTQRKRGSTAL